jgi:hypothetical protein
MSCTKATPAACVHVVDASKNYATQGIALLLDQEKRVDAFTPGPTIKTYQKKEVLRALRGAQDTLGAHKIFSPSQADNPVYDKYHLSK